MYLILHDWFRHEWTKDCTDGSNLRGRPANHCVGDGQDQRCRQETGNQVMPKEILQFPAIFVGWQLLEDSVNAKYQPPPTLVEIHL